ncbi:MAG: hypothetical protein HN736_02885 [Anaerolineae bacterium]|jgi:hypothetical protein|nr:hypothetical protein [Anaerolineae bacterium]MBT3712223.1 hypothetical protein [Anaerolineae bacterium]MBT4311969.1 hypothetical protein [Anaerolineae bacterium]MBT4459369.1 hypothetical protein [Anaerolineae bacterium]MBT4841271.1 hypothetical protein [Anaerolineae bacterium]
MSTQGTRRFNLSIILIVFSLLMACILPQKMEETFVDIFIDTEEERCIQEGGDWHYAEKIKRWVCLTDIAPFMPLDESEDNAEAPSQVEAPSEVDTSVPDGTYIGTTTLPDYWDNLNWAGTIEENAITIIVAADGSVSGVMIAVGKGYKSDPIDGCVSQINFYTEAALSGQLTEIGGPIDFQITRTKEIWRSGCPSGTETTTESGNMQAQVSIIDNQIIRGAVPNYFSIETRKR